MKFTKLLFLVFVTSFLVSSDFGLANKVLVRVNDNLITDVDVDRRIYALRKLHSNQPQKLNFLRRDRVLRDLIREGIKQSTVSKVENVEIFDEIDLEFVEKSWASSMRIPLGLLKELKAEDKIVSEELEKIIASEGKWQILIRQKVQERQKEPVSESELDLEIEYLRRFAGEPEFFLQEVFIAYDPAQSKQDLLLEVEALAEQVRNEDVNFNDLVENRSQSSTKINGGILGWISATQLAPSVVENLLELGPNGIAQVVTGDKGYHIYRLLNRRAVNLAGKLATLYYAAYTVKDAKEQDLQQKLDEAKNLLSKASRDINSCIKAEQIFSSMQTKNIKTGYIKDIALTKLDPRTLKAIDNLQPGDTSEPAAYHNTVQMFTLCNFGISRESEEIKNIIRRQILMQGYEAIENDFFNQMQRRTVILFGDDE